MPSYNALVITPAYGRDYKSATGATNDWNDGRDFVAANLTRKYVSKGDLKSYPHGFTHVHLRYDNLTKVVVIDLNKEAK